MTSSARAGTMRTLSMLVAAAGVAACVLVGIATVGSPTVVLAAPCYDDGCNYQDPQTTGCSSDGITVDTIYDSDGYAYFVNLRWSSNCGANWARAQNEGCNAPYYTHCYTGYAFFSLRGSTQIGTTGWFDDPQALNTYWSYMLSGATSLDKVCEYENWNKCTAWH